MPYRYLPLVTGEIYHVMNRGVAKAPIFVTGRDYKRLLETIDYYRFEEVPIRLSHFKTLSIDQHEAIKADLIKKDKKIVEVIAYCLMPNHFHLLLKQIKDGGISDFMRKSCVSYGKYFNTKSERVGSLFQGMFKAVRVLSEEQLLHIIRYIHINPYTGMVINKAQLKTYPWSSLQEYLSEKTAGLVDRKTISELFSSPQKHWEFVTDEADYRRQVKENILMCLE